MSDPADELMADAFKTMHRWARFGFFASLFGAALYSPNSLKWQQVRQLTGAKPPHVPREQWDAMVERQRAPMAARTRQILMLRRRNEVLGLVASVVVFGTLLAVILGDVLQKIGTPASLIPCIPLLAIIIGYQPLHCFLVGRDSSLFRKAFVFNFGTSGF